MSAKSYKVEQSHKSLCLWACESVRDFVGSWGAYAPKNFFYLFIFRCVSISISAKFTDSQTHRLTNSQTLSFVCLCMTVYEYVWLCMTMYAYVWLCLTIYDYLLLCMTPHDLVWLCMIMYDYVWLWMTLYNFAWLYINLYD